jgi:hypothetical protein
VSTQLLASLPPVLPSNPTIPFTPRDESVCEGGPACSGGGKGKGKGGGEGKGAGQGNGKAKCKRRGKGKGKKCGKKDGQGADQDDSPEEKGTCKVSAGAAKPDPAKGGFYFPVSFHCTGTAKRILFHEGLIRRDPTSPQCPGCEARWGGLTGGYSFPGQVISGPEEAARLLRKSWEGEFFAPCAGYATDYGPSWVVQEVSLMRNGAIGGHRAFSKPLERAKSPEVAVADLCPQL